MSYYPTIEEDLERAKTILAKGKAEPFMLGEQLQVPDGGTIYGADTYAAYKLLESFVAEIERLQEVEFKLGEAATALGGKWKECAECLTEALEHNAQLREQNHRVIKEREQLTHSFELYYKASMALMAAYKEANAGEYPENAWPDATVVNQWAAAKIERLQIDPGGSDRIDELESALGHVAEGTVLVQRSMQAKLDRATTERDEWEQTAQNFHDLVDKFFGLFSDYEDPCTSFEQAESIWNDMKNREARLYEEKRQQLELLTQIRTLADQTTGTDRSKGDPRESGAIGAVKLLVQHATKLRERVDQVEGAMNPQDIPPWEEPL